MAMFYRALDTNPEHVRDVNIAKLRARYPQKFSGHDAVNRDLDMERRILDEATGNKGIGTPSDRRSRI